MLAVEPVPAGRSWGLMHSEHPMFDNMRMSSGGAVTQVWNPPSSPGFLADRQSISPMAQSLPAPRGSLVRRRPSQPQRRRRGSSSNGRIGGWKDTGGNRFEPHSSDTCSSHRGSCRSGASDGGRIGGERRLAGGCDTGWENRGGSSNSRTHYQSSRACGSSGGGGDSSETKARDSTSGGGEAWGKTSTDSDVWAWVGGGGGEARGKAMLNAYGIPSDRHNPTCPQGTPVDNGARHGRWQRGPAGGVKGRDTNVEGCVAAEDLSETSAEDINRGVEPRVGIGGSGQRVKSVGRAGASSDRTARGHGVHCQRFRKCHKQRSLASSNLDQAKLRHRLSSSGEKACGVWVTEDAEGDGEDQGLFGEGNRVDETSTCMTIPSLSPRPTDKLDSREKVGSREQVFREVTPGDHNRQSADQFRRAFDDLLVPPCSVPSSPSLGTSSLSNHAGRAAANTTVAIAEHGVLLSMDGRGGSAAPPYRPPQCSIRGANPGTAVAVNSVTLNVPLLPELVAPTTGSGTMSVFDIESNGNNESRDDTRGRDNTSTPPVSRECTLSQQSPWQERKHPRGISGEAVEGGTERITGFGHRHQETCCVRDQSIGSSARSSATISPTEIVSNGSVTMTVEDIRRTCDGMNGTRTRQSPWAASSASLARSPDVVCVGGGTLKQGSLTGSFTTDGTVSVTTTRHSCVAAAATSFSGGARGLDPFGRLPPGSANATTPQSELIDHFKLASRPTSRRGTRKQGADGEEAQPAFCLFSGHRGRVGKGGNINEVGRRVRSREGRAEGAAVCSSVAREEQP